MAAGLGRGNLRNRLRCGGNMVNGELTNLAEAVAAIEPGRAKKSADETGTAGD